MLVKILPNGYILTEAVITGTTKIWNEQGGRVATIQAGRLSRVSVTRTGQLVTAGYQKGEVNRWEFPLL